MPSDPPFLQQELECWIVYKVVGAIKADGDKRAFQHDFLPRGRAGPLDHVRLRFTIEPCWKHDPIAATIEKENVRPDERLTIATPLQLSGRAAGPPGHFLRSLMQKVDNATIRIRR